MSANCDFRMLMILQTVSTVEELRLPVYQPVVAVMFDQDKVSTCLIKIHIFSVYSARLWNEQR